MAKKRDDELDELAELTPVIFRNWRGKDGTTIALFPEDPADYTGDNCNSYEHVGQHGGASPWAVMRDTVPAPRGEVVKLRAELRRLGYTNLKELKRVEWSKAAKIRRKKVARMGL